MIGQHDSFAGIPTYQLRVILSETDPLIWRRLQVPGNASLAWLHAVLQVAMGWTNSHLHQFICGERVFGDPDAELEQFGDDPPVLNERKATLIKVVQDYGDGIFYEYDFGDSWEHLVLVEEVRCDPQFPARTAVCVAGERACPPEDCGGVGGYEQLLKILRNRRHPEHKSMKEWLGRPFDAERFDVARTNDFLRMLKWPRTTETQLGKVLMARDSY